MIRRPQSAVAKPSSYTNLLKQTQNVDDVYSLKDQGIQQLDSLDHFTNVTQKQNILRPLSGYSDTTQVRKPNFQRQQNQPNFYKVPQEASDMQSQKSKDNNLVPVEQIQRDLQQARYALGLNQIEEAIYQYSSALNKAAHVIPSLKFVELFGQVIQALNSKAIHSVHEDLKLCEPLIQTLVFWTQLIRQARSQQNQFLQYIKCPYYYQALVLNTQAKFLIKTNKYEDAQNALDKALNILSSTKIDDPDQEHIIGLTYLNISTTFLYQTNYPKGMQFASTALTHLQQCLIHTQSENIKYKNDENIIEEQDEAMLLQIAENITDAYINLAIGKEKTKLFQEAHFNYYSALVNCKQYLPAPKQTEVQAIYDNFLSRQAGYLQNIGLQSLKNNQLRNKTRSPFSRYSQTPIQKTSQQPFIDIVKSLVDSGKVMSGNFAKKQRMVFKQKKEIEKKQMQSLSKFKPYIDDNSPISGAYLPKFQRAKSQTKIKAKSGFYKTENFGKELEQNLTLNQTNNLKQQKSFKIKSNIPQFNPFNKIQKPQNFQKQVQDEIQQGLQDENITPPSPVLKFLEGIVNNKQQFKDYNVFQTEDFQDIRITQHPLSYNNDNIKSSIMVGRLTVYAIKAKHILYLRYYAYEQNVIDQFQQQNKQDYQFKIYAHSFNISDIANEFYTQSLESKDGNNEADKRYSEFIRFFILEICKYLFVNISKQTLQISKTLNQVPQQGQKQPLKQICFYLSQIQEYISIQLKNDYESIVYVTNDAQLQDAKEDEIFPLVYQENKQPQPKDDFSEEIKPLMVDNYAMQEQPNVYQEEAEQNEDVELANAATLIQRKFRNRQQSQKQQSNTTLTEVSPFTKKVVIRPPYQGRVDYDEAEEVFDIMEENESQEKTGTIQKLNIKVPSMGNPVSSTRAKAQSNSKNGTRSTNKSRKPPIELQLPFESDEEKETREDQNAVALIKQDYQQKKKHFKQNQPQTLSAPVDQNRMLQKQGSMPTKEARKPQEIKRVQEKFTIKIGSEDHEQKEVIEVYAEKKEIQPEQIEDDINIDLEDPEVANAAKLIQQKFRLRKIKK